MAQTAEKKGRPKLGVRAFVVSDHDGDHGAEVVYAESAGQAKACGMTESDFTDRVVKRAPELDKYLETGGPTKADLLEHGWWFECHFEDKENHRGCFERVTAETGGIHDGKPFCQYHLALVRGADVDHIAGELLTFLSDTLPAKCGSWKLDDYLWVEVERREQFIGALQERFGITIPDADAVEATGNKVSDLAGYIGLRMLIKAELAAANQPATPVVEEE